jgi:hypothetical protein
MGNIGLYMINVKYRARQNKFTYIRGSVECSLHQFKREGGMGRQKILGYFMLASAGAIATLLVLKTHRDLAQITCEGQYREQIRHGTKEAGREVGTEGKNCVLFARAVYPADPPRVVARWDMIAKNDELARTWSRDAVNAETAASAPAVQR